MDSIINTLVLPEALLELHLKHHEPFISYNGTLYQELPLLLKACPALLSQDHLLIYCQVANFLFAGVLYDVIDNPTSFKARYHATPPLNEMVEDSTILARPLLGPFNISEIALPRVSGATVTYYVEDTYNNVPYRVRCPYPYHDTNIAVDYDLLPTS